MDNKADLAGRRFGRLVAISVAGKDKWGATMWLCLCDCGNNKKVKVSYLLSGACRSCGCLQSESRRKNRRTHGKSKSREYSVWAAMLRRCYNKNTKDYHLYGGRGVVVCDAWKSFENFFQDMGAIPGPGFSIGRIDNDAGYSKDNCRWEDAIQQANNKRSTRTVRYNGKDMTARDLAEIAGIKRRTMYERLFQHGWSVERALSEPVRNW